MSNIQKSFQHGSLFSGIGGFDLAAEWMGWENVFHCEWNGFGQKVLKHYWPKAKSYEDITTTDFSIHSGKLDILTGGFPCQPYSQAGKRLGKEDDCHLWPEMLRAIKEIQPTYIVGENVLGIVNWNGGLVFDEVQVDLENEGYEVQAVILPACAVGALHRRDRTWFIGYCKENRRERVIANPIKKRLQESCTRFRKEYELFKDPSNESSRSNASQWSKTRRGSGYVSGCNGIPEELDKITFSKWKQESIKAYGNAIVPQVACEIFKVINRLEQTKVAVA